ncbi:MAG: phage tail assembly protein [Pseudomonadota bacterium]|nr:phage tail assembly protein [Pseudomonadota bacterium]
MNIALKTPIKRGETAIDAVELRKPTAGELRGVSLVELLQMDVGAISKVLPRITMPALIPEEIAGMDPADLLAMGATISGFLLPTAAPASPDVK